MSGLLCRHSHLAADQRRIIFFPSETASGRHLHDPHVVVIETHGLLAGILHIVGALHRAEDFCPAVFVDSHGPLGLQVGLLLVAGGEGLFDDLRGFRKDFIHRPSLGEVIMGAGIGRLIEGKNRLIFFIGDLGLGGQLFHCGQIRTRNHEDSLPEEADRISGKNRLFARHDFQEVLSGHVVRRHGRIALRQVRKLD